MLIEAAGFPDQAGERVLVQGNDPQLTAAVGDVVGRLKRVEGITEIQSPLRSTDGHSVVVSFKIPGSDEQVERLVDRPLAAVAAAQKAHPRVRVEQFGDASAAKAIAAQDAKDGKNAERISFVLMLVILLVALARSSPPASRWCSAPPP